MSSYLDDPLIGSRLDGRYAISGVLGRGGMGVVYEGMHEELGRAVAIKVLFPNHATDAVVVERFVREARIASNLAHGNIVEVSDLGRLPDGRPYLVMPKVHGVDFATLLVRERSMAPARVVSLLRGVAAALDLVHAEGLVHRDVKPENLMHVVRADGSEHVLLMDFGIASLLGDASRLSDEGVRCGTPAYMAPEFIASGEFDRRADVYALATVAFEMLTGHLPFDDAHALRIMNDKTNNPAPRLSDTAGKDFGAALERVLARGLVRDPALRYPSTGEFVAALEQAVTGGAHPLVEGDAPTVRLSVRPTPAPGEATLPSTRPSRAAPLLALLLLLSGALVALALFFGLGPPAASSTRRAVPATAATGDAIAKPAAPDPIGVPVLAPIEPQPQPQLVPAAVPRTTRNADRVRRQAAPVEPVPPVQAPVEASAPSPAADAVRAARDTRDRAADRELLQGHLARAVELFESAIKADANDGAAFRGLGLAHERLGHNAAAARAYQRALELEPEGAHSAKLRERLQRLQPSE